VVAGTAAAVLLELVDESLVERSSVDDEELLSVEAGEDVELALLVVLLAAVGVARAANPVTRPSVARMLVARVALRASAAG